MPVRSLVVSFAALALAVMAAATPAAAQIANGGFEAASDEPPVLGQWQYDNGALRSSGSVHSGAFAAAMDNLLEATNVNVHQQTTPGSITPGLQYTLSYWAHADYGVSGVGQMQLAFLNAAGNILPGSPQFTNIPATASFAQYVQNVTAPIDASAIFLGFNSVTGAVIGASSHLVVDDVSFSSGAGSFDPADFNHDTFVDGLDLAAWKTAFTLINADADADHDQDSDGADVAIWQQRLGNHQATPAIAEVPEPTTLVAAIAGLAIAATRRRR